MVIKFQDTFCFKKFTLQISENCRFVHYFICKFENPKSSFAKSFYLLKSETIILVHSESNFYYRWTLLIIIPFSTSLVDNFQIFMFPICPSTKVYILKL
jgi:hypothetical protein